MPASNDITYVSALSVVYASVCPCMIYRAVGDGEPLAVVYVITFRG